MDNELDLAIEQEVEAQRERAREFADQSELYNYDEEVVNLEDDLEEADVYSLKRSEL